MVFDQLQTWLDFTKVLFCGWIGCDVNTFYYYYYSLYNVLQYDL